MASFQDGYSTMLSDDVSRLNDQDIGLSMRGKVEPVTDNEAKSFSSELKSPYTCTICCKSFLRKDTLKRHLIIHSGERPFFCEICQKAFFSSSNLNRHKLSHIGLTIRPKVEPATDNEAESFSSELKSPYTCTICSKSFLRKHNLNRHLIIHSEERSFICDICQKAFFRNSNLNRHKLSHMRLTVRTKS